MRTFWAPTSALLAFGHFETSFWVYESHWKLRPWNFACTLILILRIFWCYLWFKQRFFAYQKFRKIKYFLLIFIKIPVLCRKHCQNRPHASCQGHKNVVRSVFNLFSVLSLELWLVARGMLIQISVLLTIWCKSQHLGAEHPRRAIGMGRQLKKDQVPSMRTLYSRQACPDHFANGRERPCVQCDLWNANTFPPAFTRRLRYCDIYKPKRLESIECNILV